MRQEGLEVIQGQEDEKNSVKCKVKRRKNAG